MSKYRLTTRGKVVLSLLVLVIAISIVQSVIYVSTNFSNIIGSELNIANEANNTLVDTTASNEKISSTEAASTIKAGTTATIETDTTATIDIDKTSVPESTVESVTKNDDPSIIETEDERNLLNASTTIYFTSDQAVLSEVMKTSIDAFCLTAKAYPAMRIRVEGVALRLLDIDKSEEIADARSQAVVDYILRNGITLDRIDVTTRIANRSDFSKDELQKAIVAELYFDGYLRTGK